MQAVHACDVLGDPLRRRILELLADGELTSGAVCAVIQREFGITQPGVSTRRLYSVNPAGLRDVDAWLDRFRRFWTPHLGALETVSGGKTRRRQKIGDAEGVA